MKDSKWMRMVILAAGLLISLRLFFLVPRVRPRLLPLVLQLRGRTRRTRVQRVLVGVTLLHALGIAVVAGKVLLVTRKDGGIG